MSAPTFVAELRTAKSERLKDGSCPVVLRITFQRVSTYIRLGMYALISEWDKRHNRFKKFLPNAERKNNRIDDLEYKAEEIYYQEFLNAGRTFAVESFKEIFRRQNAGTNFVAYTKKVVKEIYQGTFRKKLAARTGKHLEDSMNAVRKYMPNAEDLTFEEINKEWLIKFEKICLEGKCTEGGVASYLRGIKSIYKKAIEDDLVDQKSYPFKSEINFKGYSFSHLRSQNIKDTLEKEELARLSAHNCKDDMYKLAIKMYIFSYLSGGTNFEDMVRFERTDIKTSSLCKYIHFYRKKTQNTSGSVVIVPLVGMLEDLVNEYVDENRRYIFPVLKDHQEGDSRELVRYVVNFENSLNKRLKRAAKIEGMEKNVTLYTARHSAGTLGLMEGATLEELATMFGHSDTKTTKIYTRHAITPKMIETIKRLQFI